MRAAIGGSLLASAGLTAEVVGVGGVPDWVVAHPVAEPALATARLGLLSVGQRAGTPTHGPSPYP